MSNEFVDDDDSGFSADDSEQAAEAMPSIKEQSDARRRIEELMERRHLKTLLDDPYRDDFDEEL